MGLESVCMFVNNVHVMSSQNVKLRCPATINRMCFTSMVKRFTDDTNTNN